MHAVVVERVLNILILLPAILGKGDDTWILLGSWLGHHGHIIKITLGLNRISEMLIPFDLDCLGMILFMLDTLEI